MESALWGLIGTMVGAAASIATTWISSRNAASLQSSASLLAREELHRAFQRDTCMELQEALNDLLRLAVRGYLADAEAFRETGKWGRQKLGEEIGEGSRLAHRKVHILKARISDDALRADVETLLGKVTSLSMARQQHDADSLNMTVLMDAPLVMEHIGRVLRGQYAPALS